MEPVYYSLIAFAIGFLLDQLLGDPERLPHPIVAFGRAIAFFEKRLNAVRFRFEKGMMVATALIIAVFMATLFLVRSSYQLHPLLGLALEAILVFYGLAAKTLRSEVQQVFEKLEISLDAGRQQLARIVGRETSELNEQQIRSAALETLSENLSDGVVAPLFWFALLGAPGLMAYKMVNTLDSMVGYKNERYVQYGKFAAKFDDFCNYIPARLTALLMLASRFEFSKLGFVKQQSKNHSSPNSGYPESALAAVLDCRFGGPNRYFGVLVDKPFIGYNQRNLVFEDLKIALSVNLRSEWLMFVLAGIFYGVIYIQW